MIRSVRTTIPGGVGVHGDRSHEAELRELTGEDEAYLMEECPSLLPAQWTTEVLARCLVSLGGQTPITREAISTLTIGDREALLLQVRRLSVGEQMPCVLTCPSPHCGEKLDLELKVADLLVPPYVESTHMHETCVSDKESTYRIRFRLPTGSDQEAAALLARTDLCAATHLLLERCIQSITSTHGAAVEGFPSAVREQLPAKMAELDAQAELTLRVICPACGGPFVALFNVGSYLFQEMQSAMRDLYCQVHLLAYHYRWSASEILKMSVRQRKRYLQPLEEQLAQATSA